MCAVHVLLMLAGMPAAVPALSSRLTAPSSPDTACYIHLETSEGYVDSPNYPDSYPAGLDCCYDIARPSADHCGVRLYAERLNILQHPHDDPLCRTDWLAMESCVPEGGSRFCGNMTGSTLHFMFQPGSRALRLQFHSSHEPRRDWLMGAGVGAKWQHALHYRLRYRTLTDCRGLFEDPGVTSLPGLEHVPCYVTVREQRGAIRSPFYPRPYPPGLDCVYHFIRTSPFICGIRMRTHSFQLEPAFSTPFGGACSDFFHTPGCGFLCGSLNFTWLSRYQPGATAQRFLFHSDHAHSHRGFHITFEQLYECL